MAGFVVNVTKVRKILYFCNKMTYSQFYKVTDSKLVITLPPEFKDKRVLVTIDDKAATEKDKMTLMKLAANDPLFLSDLKEVNDDFEGIEHETL
jgi:hypothetical protein